MTSLLSGLRGAIAQARQQALSVVDNLHAQACWEIGQHIVEYEQGVAGLAQYGARLLPLVAASLTGEFGKGFDERRPWYFKRFFLRFPILNALRSELSRIHYRSLLKANSDQPLRLRISVSRRW